MPLALNNNRGSVYSGANENIGSREVVSYCYFAAYLF